MGLVLYRCRKKRVCGAYSENKHIEDFFRTIEPEYNTYIGTEENLREYCENDAQFDALKAFFDEHDLWEYDLVIEE